jgi:intracellular sulfur oxidation DsrE/DsrF family protein
MEDFSMTQYTVKRFAALATTAKRQPRQSLRTSWLLFAMASACCVSGVQAQDAVVNPPLHIDIPTTLERANVVIDYGHAVFNGDMPFGLADANLLATDLRDWKTQGHFVVIFHGDAAYLILNDETYNANRHVSTGNPYKNVLNSLMADGVQLELCGATAQGNHWGNANLLPGIKVNVNAMVRVTQLEEQGYSMIYE